jgi:hypothetical protein
MLRAAERGACAAAAVPTRSATTAATTDFVIVLSLVSDARTAGMDSTKHKAG